MTKAEYIRKMKNDELVRLLVYGMVKGITIPDCSDNCGYFDCGCLNDCPRDRREKAVREWLESEV